MSVLVLSAYQPRTSLKIPFFECSNWDNCLSLHIYIRVYILLTLLPTLMTSFPYMIWRAFFDSRLLLQYSNHLQRIFWNLCYCCPEHTRKWTSQTVFQVSIMLLSQRIILPSVPYRVSNTKPTSTLHRLYILLYILHNAKYISEFGSSNKQSKHRILLSVFTFVVSVRLL